MSAIIRINSGKQTDNNEQDSLVRFQILMAPSMKMNVSGMLHHAVSYKLTHHPNYGGSKHLLKHSSTSMRLHRPEGIFIFLFHFANKDDMHIN
jgi:hypothetical protein